MTFDITTDALLHEHLVGVADGFILGVAFCLCVALAIFGKAIEEGL